MLTIDTKRHLNFNQTQEPWLSRLLIFIQQQGQLFSIQIFDIQQCGQFKPTMKTMRVWLEGTDGQFFFKIYTHMRTHTSLRNICPTVPSVPPKELISPLSLRYPSVNDKKKKGEKHELRWADAYTLLGTEDQMDQMFCKYTRAYVRIYIEKNWSVGPTGPLHSST